MQHVHRMPARQAPGMCAAGTASVNKMMGLEAGQSRAATRSGDIRRSQRCSRRPVTFQPDAGLKQPRATKSLRQNLARDCFGFQQSSPRVKTKARPAHETENLSWSSPTDHTNRPSTVVAKTTDMPITRIGVRPACVFVWVTATVFYFRFWVGKLSPGTAASGPLRRLRISTATDGIEGSSGRACQEFTGVAAYWGRAGVSRSMPQRRFCRVARRNFTPGRSQNRT